MKRDVKTIWCDQCEREIWKAGDGRIPWRTEMWLDFYGKDFCDDKCAQSYLDDAISRNVDRVREQEAIEAAENDRAKVESK